MGEEMRNLKIVFFHVLLNVLAIGLFIFLEKTDLVIHISQIYVIVILPIVYIILGYRYVSSNGRYERFINLSIISIIGIFIVVLCFYNYINDDIEARAERAVIPIVLPAEVVWLFYGIYNLFLFSFYFVADWIGYSGKPISKYVLSLVILLINFLPQFFMWIGLTLRNYIERNRKNEKLKTIEG
jgi:hypothetical protein